MFGRALNKSSTNFVDDVTKSYVVLFVISPHDRIISTFMGKINYKTQMKSYVLSFNTLKCFACVVNFTNLTK